MKTIVVYQWIISSFGFEGKPYLTDDYYSHKSEIPREDVTVIGRAGWTRMEVLVDDSSR